MYRIGKNVYIIICPVCRMEEVLCPVFSSDKNVKGRNSGKIFWNIDPEIEIRKTVRCKNKEVCQKLVLYLNRCRKKWERKMKKSEGNRRLN
jgi:hypothetical protein